VEKIKVTEGSYFVDIPEVGLSILCGCPENAVKFMIREGLILKREKAGKVFETGPNALLLSESPFQNGSFCNLAEFPVLQMLYMQGMILPGHPNNTGAKPILVGLKHQVEAQARYINLGNYGNTDPKELAKAGLSEAEAAELMRMKLWFAFGAIKSADELLDLRPLERDAIELKPGLIAHRLAFNRYEFLCGSESVEVDMNLVRGQTYGAPYALPSRRICRHFFSIIHSGEGDGWDPDRPCMASIVCYRGEYYLVDAGPNVEYSLKALGIGIGEIAGVFQTHAHDDHFVGLPSLLRSDRKVKYYATPLVRRSVVRKLCALTSLTEPDFGDYFEVRDLEVGRWNDDAGLEVMPIASPHPLETTILLFRARGEEGYKTYAHLADLASFRVLDNMVSADSSAPGMSAQRVEEAKSAYLVPADVKKIDIGGGMIHGRAADFAGDASGTIFLSHVARPLNDAERAIGACADFGSESVLIPAREDYSMLAALRFLRRYYPNAPLRELEALVACPRVSLLEGDLIARAGSVPSEVWLTLSGAIEKTEPETGFTTRLAAGCLFGELACVSGRPIACDYRAASGLEALRVPAEVFLDFAARNAPREEILRLSDLRDFLERTELFSEAVSSPILATIAASMKRIELAKGERPPEYPLRSLSLVASGSLRIKVDSRKIETAGPGAFFGEESIILGAGGLLSAVASEDSSLYLIPRESLEGIPVVFWKLRETLERRFSAAVAFFKIEWKPEYSVRVEAMDAQHRTLFAMVDEVQRCFAEGREDPVPLVAALVEFTRLHFRNEEAFLAARGYPGTSCQENMHKAFLARVSDYERAFAKDDRDFTPDFMDFMKAWLLSRTLFEDRKYGNFLNETGLI